MDWALTVAAGIWLAALTACDLRTHRLPNLLTGPGAAAILAAAALAGAGGAAALGATALAGVYLGAHLCSPSSLGGGDVKLAVGLGALTGAFGAGAWLLAALGAPLLTLIWALAGRRRLLPHGPSMCLASALAVLLAGAGPAAIGSR